jgi:F-type H+-transporting ATPase subunit alpha
MLDRTARQALRAFDAALQKQHAEIQAFEIGIVEQVATGIARVSGLPEVEIDELVRFPGDLLGIASNLEPDAIGVILLGDSDRLRSGDRARRTGRVIDVPVGERLLGRVVDALGRPLDEHGSIETIERRPIERPAPTILDRAPVAVPLQTGIKVIDALIPIGRGQRELILGDRQTGKTAVAVDTILHQRDQGVLSIYCAIGQRASAVARVIADLRTHGVMDRCIVVVASGEDAPGLQFVAPYAATAMAEHLMARGRDVLVVYDDLTRHARAYRELSLLLRRPPGREAYPGDIFYLHSRLLERATHLREDQGGGSLTALPIIETQAQNLSAYIPTNLISITDGQVYLSPDLYQKGQLPAVEVGRSVSRVGGRAQRPAYRAVTADLRLAYAQFEELEAFSRFGTRLDAATRANLERGRRVRAVLKQPQYDLQPVEAQIAILLAVTHGLLDPLPLERIADGERAIRAAVGQAPDLARQIETGITLGDAERTRLVALARSALEREGLIPAGGADANP